MKRQVIQNFLNLPGISGVALIDGRNRPFFFGPDISLNSHQQDVLAQGIQQVVSTTSDNFDTFSFRFTNQLAHIYKLDQGVILLVLMAESQPLADYRSAVSQLKATLMEAPHNVVPTFRLVAGCVTLNGPSQNTPASPAPGAERAELGTLTITFEDTVVALNHLSHSAAQYLGNVIVANTWKQARPANPWLDQFELQPNGSFRVVEASTTSLTEEQQQWVREWVSAFLQRGGRTIRNFHSLVSDTALTPQEKQLLLSPPPRSPDSPS
ncbi:hypothetical protein [Nodosilinea sp. P-1105]|uniref:hypothetical protein n=1 Tax=Nodosilinea sp. P-1105 TaxID=2546229 RepID=UPI00146DEA37|nr:hypothetical protein [Nodosilinea sp. P-1105]NMF82294.1 hypothetical protein [Nodosilinea sp. P-1105]